MSKSKNTVKLNSGPLTLLQKGMLFKHQGAVYRVDMVNECRARCVPVNRVKVEREMFDKRTGENKVVSFEHDGAAINISPNSEVEIVKQ